MWRRQQIVGEEDGKPVQSSGMPLSASAWVVRSYGWPDSCTRTPCLRPHPGYDRTP